MALQAVVAVAGGIKTLADAGSVVVTAGEGVYTGHKDRQAAATQADREYHKWEAEHRFEKEKYYTEERKIQDRENIERRRREDEENKAWKQSLKEVVESSVGYRLTIPEPKIPPLKKRPSLPKAAVAPPAVSASLPMNAESLPPVVPDRTVLRQADRIMPACPSSQPRLSPPMIKCESDNTATKSQGQVVNDLALKDFAPALLAMSVVGLAYLAFRCWEGKQKKANNQRRQKPNEGRRHPRDFKIVREN